MSIKDTVSELAEELDNALGDCEKFERGNDAAGRRIRSTLMSISKACKELRTVIQEERNARKG
jgi:hypothetical protein